MSQSFYDTPGVTERRTAVVPTRRIGMPQDIADAILFLASDRSSYVNGDEITVESEEDGMRFLLISGKPIGEPVAWYGPIVMNTQDQLKEAFEELERGTFLRNG